LEVKVLNVIKFQLELTSRLRGVLVGSSPCGNLLITVILYYCVLFYQAIIIRQVWAWAVPDLACPSAAGDVVS
jgi:hypothetical protein